MGWFALFRLSTFWSHLFELVLARTRNINNEVAKNLGLVYARGVFPHNTPALLFCGSSLPDAVLNSS